MRSSSKVGQRSAAAVAPPSPAAAQAIMQHTPVGAMYVPVRLHQYAAVKGSQI